VEPAAVFGWRSRGGSLRLEAAPSILMMGVPQLRPGSPPVRIFVQPTDYENSDHSTAQTVQAMCAGIHRASRDDFFRGCAHAVPYRYKGEALAPAAQLQRLPAASRQKAAVAIADWWFCKHFIRFVQDQALTRRLLGYSDALEALMEPAVMIRCEQPEGDCDDFTMFICALLQCQGIPWQIVTLACSRRQPGIWSHVFPRAVIGSLRLPLDASHGTYPGWSVPARDIQRMAVWGPDGNLVLPAQEEVI
jgi:hypothetical protein